MTTATLNLTLGTATREFRFRPKTSDEGVIVQVFKNSDYNFKRLRRGEELMRCYERAVASNKTPLIVDAGANIGASPLYFAYSFPKAQVIAIEPERENFELLQANTRGAAVNCIQGALASRDGNTDLMDPGEGSWGFRTAAAGGGKPTGQSVSCVTMNGIYRDNDPRCVPFIAKIDIEGGEHELFSGNTEWITKTPLIIIELHDWLLPRSANSRPFLHCISGYDRDFVYVGENIFSIDNNLDALGAAWAD